MSLQLLVVSTGRSGTKSLTAALAELYRLNGVAATVRHETQSMQLYPALLHNLRTADARPLLDLLRGWRHTAEVGNGFAFCMGQVAAAYGPGVKVVALRRGRAATIASLCRRPQVNPRYWGGYSDEPVEFTIHRPTAADLGEMSREAWRALPMEGRMAWYYDATFRLLAASRPLFREFLELDLEALQAGEGLQRLACFIDPGWRAPAALPHLNAAGGFDYAALQRKELQRLEALNNERDWQGMDGAAAEALRQKLLEQARGER